MPPAPQSTNDPKRLAVFVLADVSGSMAGAPLKSVQDGLAAIVKELRGDAELSRGVFLSLIAYGRSVAQAAPLNSASSFAIPQLKAGGFTPLGEALKFAQPLAAKEARALLLILSDGHATDEIRQSARALAELPTPCVMAYVKPNDWQPAPRAIRGLKVKLTRNEAAGNLFKWIGEAIRAAYFGSLHLDSLTAFPAGVALWPDELPGPADDAAPELAPKPAPAVSPPRKAPPLPSPSIEIEMDEPPPQPDKAQRAKQTTILFNDPAKSTGASKRAKPAAEKQASIAATSAATETPPSTLDPAQKPTAPARKRGGLFDHLTGV